MPQEPLLACCARYRAVVAIQPPRTRSPASQFRRADAATPDDRPHLQPGRPAVCLHRPGPGPRRPGDGADLHHRPAYGGAPSGHAARSHDAATVSGAHRERGAFRLVRHDLVPALPARRGGAPRRPDRRHGSSAPARPGRAGQWCGRSGRTHLRDQQCTTRHRPPRDPRRPGKCRLPSDLRHQEGVPGRGAESDPADQLPACGNPVGRCEAPRRSVSRLRRSARDQPPPQLPALPGLSLPVGDSGSSRDSGRGFRRRKGASSASGRDAGSPTSSTRGPRATTSSTPTATRSGPTPTAPRRSRSGGTDRGSASSRTRRA